MEDKKVINIDFNKTKKEGSEKKQTTSFSLHTNPIIKRMLAINLESKKNKFSLKDWFK